MFETAGRPVNFGVQTHHLFVQFYRQATGNDAVARFEGAAFGQGKRRGDLPGGPDAEGVGQQHMGFALSLWAAHAGPQPRNAFDSGASITEEIGRAGLCGLQIGVVVQQDNRPARGGQPYSLSDAVIPGQGPVCAGACS